MWYKDPTELKNLFSSLSTNRVQEIALFVGRALEYGVPCEELPTLLFKLVAERFHSDKVDLAFLQRKSLQQKQGFAFRWERVGIICPDCNRLTLIREIRDPVGSRNRKGFKGHVFCFREDTDCAYEMYTKERPVEYLRQLERRKADGTR